MKNYIVYIVTFKNGKKYIGITSRGLSERKSKHLSNAKCGSPLLFHKALVKYNNDCNWEIFTKDLTKKEACDLEMELISKYKTNDSSFGYNLTAGGESTIHNKEILVKIGISNSKKPFYICNLNGDIIDKCINQSDAENRFNVLSSSVNKCLTGKRFKHRGYRFRYVDSDFIFRKKERITPRYCRPKGYKHSEETRQKMSKNRKPITEKALAALRNNAKNRIGIKLRKRTEQEIIEMARIRSTSKIFVQKESFSRVYLSLKECSDDLGLNKGSIANCLLGRRYTLRGYTFNRIKE